MDTFAKVFLACGLVFFVAVMVLAGYASKRMPRGRLLIIALVCFVASQFIPTYDRLMMGVVGVFRLTSFALILLGLIDLLRRRSPAVSDDSRGVPPIAPKF